MNATLRALFVFTALSLAGCERKPAGGGACPADWPAAKGCSSSGQECPYDHDGKKWKCTCTPDTSGPSTWQCAPLE